MGKLEKEIVDIAKLSATGFYEPSTAQFPKIKQYENIKSWDFLVTVALVGACALHLQMEEDEVKSKNIQAAIRKELTNYHPQGWKAVEDLFAFLVNSNKSTLSNKISSDNSIEKHLEKITDLSAASIGTWVVLNLKGKFPDEDEYPVCSMLGNLVYKNVGLELALKYAEKAD